MVGTITEAQARAIVARGSCYDFVREFWSVYDTQQPVWNWHIKTLCDVFEREARRTFQQKLRKKDVFVNVPPASTKSTIFSVLGPAWVWSWWPECRFIAASHTSSLSLDLALRSRAVLESEEYREAFPNVVLQGDQNVKSFFRNTSGGSRYSVGTEGKVTGRHAHMIIVDDPMAPDDIHSELKRKRVHKFMRETLPSRMINKNTSAFMVVQQRLGADDSTGERLRRDDGTGVKHICLPAELLPNTEVKPAKLRRRYVDGLLDPVRLNRRVLKDAELQQGASSYAAQYNQLETPPEGALFKTHRIKVLDNRPSVPPRRVVRYWDKAATLDDGCYTVGLKMATYPSTLTQIDPTDINEMWDYVVLDVIRVRLDSHERELLIKHTAKVDGPKVEIGIEQEAGGAGKESAQNTARRLAGYKVTLDAVQDSKGVRAVPFSSQVNAGAVCMVEAPWNDAFTEELRYFPDGPYKDQVDAASGAFSLLATRKTVVGAF